MVFAYYAKVAPPPPPRAHGLSPLSWDDATLQVSLTILLQAILPCKRIRTSMVCIASINFVYISLSMERSMQSLPGSCLGTAGTAGDSMYSHARPSMVLAIPLRVRITRRGTACGCLSEYPVCLVHASAPRLEASVLVFARFHHVSNLETSQIWPHEWKLYRISETAVGHVDMDAPRTDAHWLQVKLQAGVYRVGERCRQSVTWRRNSVWAVP